MPPSKVTVRKAMADNLGDEKGAVEAAGATRAKSFRDIQTDSYQNGNWQIGDGTHPTMPFNPRTKPKR